MSWSIVCQTKECGGLGVKPIHLWNQVAIMKYIWGLIKEKQTLWAMWVTKVKLKRLSFWGITKQADSSWSWRTLQIEEDSKSYVCLQAWEWEKIFILV